MKHLLSALLLGTTSLIASELTSTTTVTVEHAIEKYNYDFRLGYDLKGSTDTVTGTGASKSGLHLGTAFELSLGAEESVEDFSFGIRRLGTIYYHGRGTYYGINNYAADVSNLGLEGTVSIFYKATQYFQPYIGMGAGINFGTYNDHGVSLNAEKYNPTLHALIGASSQLIGPIGLYAHYKYTLADNEKQKVLIADGSGGVTHTQIDNKGVSGGRWIAGLSLVY